MTVRNACALLRFSGQRFASEPLAHLPMVRKACADLAHVLGCALPTPRKGNPCTVHAARDACSTLAVACADSPSRAALLRVWRASFAYAAACEVQQPARRLRLPKVHAPDLPTPAVSRCPSGALDWQTHPPISTPPHIVALRDDKPRATVVQKPAPAVRHNPVMTKASLPTPAPRTVVVRVGRPVLSLPPRRVNLTPRVHAKPGTLSAFWPSA